MKNRSKNFVFSFDGADHPKLDQLRETISMINSFSEKKLYVAANRRLGAGNPNIPRYPRMDWGCARQYAGYTDVYIYEVKKGNK